VALTIHLRTPSLTAYNLYCGQVADMTTMVVISEQTSKNDVRDLLFPLFPVFTDSHPSQIGDDLNAKIDWRVS